MTEYVAGFMFYERYVVLVQKAKPAWQKGRLNGVGGKIEPGETPRQAVQREFHEETRYATFESDWTHFVTLHGKDWRVYFFRAERELLFALRDDPVEPCYWCESGHLSAQVVPNLRWLIPMARDKDLRLPIDIHDDSDPNADGMTVTEGVPA